MVAPIHFSHSQIGTLLECGEKYRLTKIAHVPQVPAWWFVSGSAFHQATEAFDRAWSEGCWSVDEIVEEWIKQFEIEVARNAEVEPDTSKWAVGGRGKEDGVWILEQGASWVKAYRTWRLESDLELFELNDAPAIEVSYTAIIAGFPVKGAVDRVFVNPDGQLLIVDLKTGRKPTNDQQLAEYAVALKQVVELDVTYGAFYMARTGALTEPVDLSRFGIKEYEALVSHAALIRDARSFIPQPSSFCKSCSVRPYCRLNGVDPFISEYAEVFS